MYGYSLAGLGADQSPFFSLVNTSGSRNFPNFQTGDPWLITIAGPANAPIFVSSIQNGTPKPAQQFGTTDSNGNFSFEGSMLPEAVGNWSETWYLGKGGAGAGDPTRNLLTVANFSVAAPQTSANATNTTTPPIAPIPPTGSGCTDGPGIVCFGSMAIPTWALYAGAGLAAFLLLSGRRR